MTPAWVVAAFVLAAAASSGDRHATPSKTAYHHPPRTPTARATKWHVVGTRSPPRPTPTPTERASPTPTPRSTAVAPTPAVDASDLERLRERALLFPVPAVSPATVRDTFADRRGGAAHEALDVPAPRGAPVVAVDDGVVAKLFTSVPGGLTVYVFDDARRYAYYYAHLDGYAEGLVEGKRVCRGDVLGFVGSTGNAAAEAPHLHFAIFKLEPEPRWWVGTAIDPYPLVVRPTP